MSSRPPPPPGIAGAIRRTLSAPPGAPPVRGRAGAGPRDHRRHVTQEATRDRERQHAAARAVRRTSRELIAEFDGARSVELVSAFARPLTTQTTAHVLGVPPADHPRFTGWNLAVALLVSGAQITPGSLTEYLAAMAEFSAYFRRHIARLRAAPDGSLLSHIVHDGAAGPDPLTDDELVRLCLLLLAAGGETTVWLIVYAALRLAQDPDLAAALRREPAGMPGFVEEVLRVEELLAHFAAFALDLPVERLAFRPHLITPSIEELYLRLTPAGR